MKKLFLRFALFVGLFLVGFASDALAYEPDYVTLKLTVQTSQYKGGHGTVAISAENVASPVPGTFAAKQYIEMLSTKRNENNTLRIYAKPNDGYKFANWSDKDNSTSYASTDREALYSALWKDRIYRQLMSATGTEVAGETYKYSDFNFYVVDVFIFEHHPKHTLYAVFVPNDYTITFMDGTTEKGTKTVTYNEKYGALPTYEKAGYIFEGWYKNADFSGTAVSANDVYNVSPAGDQTLYAKYTPITHTIHFADQEQSKTFANATYSGTTMPSLPTANYLPVVEDKYFAGFYTKPNGQGDRVYAGVAEGANLKLLKSLTLTSDITLYAHYSHVHHKMYWDYSYNNGTWNNMNPTEYLKYARLTFKKANGEEIKTVILEATDPTEVKPTASMTADLATHTTSLANIKLAVGTADDVLNAQEVKVYFTDEQLAAFAAYTFEAISVKDPIAVATNWVVTTHKEGHNTVLNYVGATGDNIYSQAWSVELNGLLVNPDYIYVMPLYWDGSEWAAISQLTHTYGVQCIKSNETDIDTKGHKKAYYTGSYPVWKKDNEDHYYRNTIGLVGFNLGGKDFWMNTTTQGAFEPFYVAAGATNPFVVDPANGENTAANPDVTINYTVPASKIPVIHFLPGATDAQLGAETPEFLVKAYGEQIADLAASYTATRPGYVFKGWKESDGTAIETPMTVDRAYTVEAQWEGAPYTVTLHKNDGTAGAGATVTAKYMEDMPTVEVPTRTGYNFKGYLDITNTYYYNNDGTSAKKYDKMADSEMWATWEAKTYTVTLKDGLSTLGTVTATYDAALPDVTVPTKLGYAFLGYFDGTGETAKQYVGQDGKGTAAWDKTADNVVLYAQWSKTEVAFTANKDQHSDDYYTTFFDGISAWQILTENTVAMIAENAVDGTLHTKNIAGDIIPAGEAVLIRTQASEFYMTPVESDMVKSTENVLLGSDVDRQQSNDSIYFVFSDGPASGDHQIGFYNYEWYTTSEGTATTKGTLKAHKAFYAAPVGSPSASPRRYVLNKANVTTDVENVNANENVNKYLINGQLVIERDGKRYNAQGQTL